MKKNQNEKRPSSELYETYGHMKDKFDRDTRDLKAELAKTKQGYQELLAWLEIYRNNKANDDHCERKGIPPFSAFFRDECGMEDPS